MCYTLNHLNVNGSLTVLFAKPTSRQSILIELKNKNLQQLNVT